jgi:hypothetical protein
MFRVVLPPIIRSAYNCIYSIWYLSHRYCYLPLSWESWNGFPATHSKLKPGKWLKSGSLNLLEPLGPVQACNGIDLPFYTFALFEVSVYKCDDGPAEPKHVDCLLLVHKYIVVLERVSSNRSPRSEDRVPPLIRLC